MVHYGKAVSMSMISLQKHLVATTTGSGTSLYSRMKLSMTLIIHYSGSFLGGGVKEGKL